MKRLTFVVLTLLTCHLTYGQETKPVTKNANGFKEEFNVLVTDKKVRHGQYKKYAGKEKLVVEGAYENNKKVGEWKFFVDGELEQTYNFTTRESKNVKKASDPTTVMVNGTIQEIQLDTEPTYFGSKTALSDVLIKEMKYPNQALRMGVEGKVLVSIWIAETGDVSEIKIIKGITDQCNAEVIRGLREIEQNWIAGTKDGQKIKSELMIVVEFKFQDGSITVL